MPVTAIPKAKILGNQAGIYKAVRLMLILIKYLEQCFLERSLTKVINIVVTAMIAKQPYTVLANQIFTHPTMAEALNDLFGSVK